MYKYDESQMVGKKFGLLTVTAKAPSDTVWRRSRWVCRCQCGVECIKLGVALKRNPKVSCGCIRYKAVSEGVRKYKTLEDYVKNTTPKNKCLEWNGHISNHGYGFVGTYNPKTAGIEKQSGLVHRRVYKLIHGNLPEVVMHTCDNRKCINPKHLIGGTQKENINDAMNKGRMFVQTKQKKLKENENA